MSQFSLVIPTKQEGQSVVEVAVLIPMLLLILLGTLDLGRGFFAYVTVANAARQAARYVSIHPSLAEDYVRQQVTAEMGGTLDIGSGGSYLSVERSGLEITDTITVTVRYSFTTVFLGPVSSFVTNLLGGSAIPNPIQMLAQSIIPISPGNLAADMAAATASSIAAASATAVGIPSNTPTLVPTVTPTPSTAWVTLSSFVAFSGESLTIWGCNFHQNRSVTIYWDGVATWSSNTDNGGCFGPSAFTVPASVSGSSHTVMADTVSGPQTLSATASPQLQVIATPTVTATATRTATATATGTSTPTQTRTPTPTATPIPIVLNVMTEEDEVVTGTAGPNVTLVVRDLSAAGEPVIGTGTALADGTFSIAVSPELVADHIILVSASNDAVVSGQVRRENSTATPSPSATGLPTGTPTVTLTPTPTPPVAAACSGTAIGGTIYEPGGGKAGDATVSLVMDGQTINTKVTGASGAYSFSSDIGGTSLQGNRSYQISVAHSGYTSNWTSVYLPCSQGVYNVDITLSTATPTPTATSSPPSSPVLSGSCTSSGSNYYHSLSWNAIAGAANYYVYRYDSNSAIWEWVNTVSGISTDVSASSNSIGTYYVIAVNASYVQSYPSNLLTVVCGNTPTPAATPTVTAAPSSTPAPSPDLFSFSMSIDPPSGSILTGESVTVTVVFYNQGSVPVNTLFWVDLYVDPSPAPPGLNQSGVAWQAVSSIGALSFVTLTFNTSFSTSSAHYLYVLVDSCGDVGEGNESNNVSSPYVVWVDAAPSPTPTADPTVTQTPLVTSTPTSTPAQSPTPSATATSTPQPGSISGDTYIYANGIWTLQGRVAVYVYSGSTLVTSVFSDVEGHYQVIGIPPGTYNLVSETEVTGILYSDTRLGVSVSAGADTPETDLFLWGA